MVTFAWRGKHDSKLREKCLALNLSGFFGPEKADKSCKFCPVK